MKAIEKNRNTNCNRQKWRTSINVGQKPILCTEISMEKYFYGLLIRRCYIEMASLIGWAHTQNDHWFQSTAVLFPCTWEWWLNARTYYIWYIKQWSCSVVLSTIYTIAKVWHQHGWKKIIKANCLTEHCDLMHFFFVTLQRKFAHASRVHMDKIKTNCPPK